MAQTQTSRKGFCSVRYGLAIILLLCNFTMFTQQMNLSITMPAMVNNTDPPSHLNAFTERPPTDSQDYWKETLKEFKAVAPVYDWSPEIQGIILSSLNYGPFLASIPTGYVTGIFGAKSMVGAGLLISSVLTLFIPLAANTGVTFLIVIRVVQGIAQVPRYLPSMVTTGHYSIWVKWAPPLERSQLTSITASGAPLGSFIIFAVGGLLYQTIGRLYIFYIFGGIGCVCSSLLWFLLIYDDPMSHHFISTGEKTYIVCALAQQGCSPGLSLPITMIKSLPLWAILVSHFLFWPFYIMMAYTPTYINTVLQVNLRDSAILSALPFIFGFICIIVGGLLEDFLLSRRTLRLITIRKLFTSIGVLFPSLLIVSLYWIISTASTIVVFFVLSPGFSSLCDSGALINILHIAPQYTGFPKGLSKVFAHIAGAISPTTAGFFISQDAELGWRNIFLLSAAINVLDLAFYLIFRQADIQDWAKEQTFTHVNVRPWEEKTRMSTVAEINTTEGIMLGSFIIFAAGGLLCQMIGWPYNFYIFGGIGCVCCLLWFLLVYDDPVNHHFFSTGEKTYIVCALTQQDCSPGWSLPIKSMLKSTLWAILILSLLADFLFSRKILSLLTIRKLFTAIGFRVGLEKVLLSDAINVFGLVFYLIFGQADFQDWAKEQTITHF
ncbi:LOW QUALITY PROTEIN: putative small intestine urate exporter [Dugong dugon]